MIALWIILGLLALILVLMLIPAGLALHYHGEDFTAEGKWLFLRFTLWPLPEKEEPEKAEKKQEKKAAEKPKKEKKSERRPFMDWLQLINDLLPVLGEALRKMGKAITLKRCQIAMVIAAEEADQTAIRYGRANALLYTHLRISRPPHPCKGIQSGSPAGLSFRAGGRDRRGRPAGAGVPHDPGRGRLPAVVERRKNLSAVCKITLRLSSGGFFL